MKPITNDQKSLLRILFKNEWKVTRDVAEEIVENIASDSAYSEDEKEFMDLIRDNDLVVFTRGTEAFLNRQLSNLNLRFHREELQDQKLASLNQAILAIAGEDKIDDAKAESIFAHIQSKGYNEKARETVQYLYNGSRMTKSAKRLLKDKIASERASRAHKAWVDKKADTEIGLLFGGNFQGAEIDITKAGELLGIIFADYQYSDQEKETMANLYRNANWGEGAKEFVQDEIHAFTTGMTLDGSVVDVFLQAIDLKNNDKEIDKKEAKQIIADLKLGSGLSQNKERTIQYCIQTFNSTEEVQGMLEAALEGDKEEAGKARVEKTAKIVEAANAGTEVEDKETATKVVPSKTLMDAYNSLKNSRGQISANQAEDFVAAIFLDGKYSKNEQETMRILRAQEAFTPAGNREVLLAIRRFLAKKNFNQ